MLKKLVISAAVFVLFSTIALARDLTVIALTDFHGALESNVTRTAGGAPVESGGAALLAAYIERIRSQTNGPTIIVDGGDLFQGSLASNLAEGAPVVRFYNAIGVTAVALGNHEFDFGPIGPHSIPMDPSDDPQGALRQRVSEAHFPFLAANVRDESGNIPEWLHPSQIIEVEGHRVGIIGIATPETPSTTVAANLRGLRFEEPVSYVIAEATRLRGEEHCSVVVLAFHGGAGCTDNSLDHTEDLSSCHGGEVFDIVGNIPANLVNVVVGGHTHQGIAKVINGTAVLQSFSRARTVGWATVPLTGGGARIAGFESVCGQVVDTDHGPSCANNDVNSSQATPRTAEFLGAPITASASIEALLYDDLERVRALRDSPAGVSALTPLTRTYFGESSLGNLVADVFRLAIPEATVAVTNGGGLRANFPTGPLTYGRIFEAFPFDNRIATIRATGGQLQRMVELGHAGSHGGLSWAGLTFHAENCVVTEVLINGEILDPARAYLVVTNDYLANGGSGFDSLGLAADQVTVLWDPAMVLRDFIFHSLQGWGRDLRATDYFDPAAPRQAVSGSCEHD